jgi:hypothetical protein
MNILGVVSRTFGGNIRWQHSIVYKTSAPLTLSIKVITVGSEIGFTLEHSNDFKFGPHFLYTSTITARGV